MADSGDAEWLKWAIGILLTILMAALGGLYKWVLSLMGKLEGLSREVHDDAAKGDDKIWQAIDKIRGEQSANYDRLRTQVEANHLEAEKYRANIQAMMATKGDMHREVDRLIDEMDRIVDAITSVYAPSEPGIRVPRPKIRRRAKVEEKIIEP